MVPLLSQPRKRPSFHLGALSLSSLEKGSFSDFSCQKQKLLGTWKEHGALIPVGRGELETQQRGSGHPLLLGQGLCGDSAATNRWRLLQKAGKGAGLESCREAPVGPFALDWTMVRGSRVRSLELSDSPGLGTTGIWELKKPLGLRACPGVSPTGAWYL